MTDITGSCLCGKMQYCVDRHIGLFQYCHCSRCRKFTGSAFGANMIVRPKDFHWLAGEQLLGRYEVPEARHYATGFCRNCGSSMPWVAQSGKSVVVPCGTLDTKIDIQPTQNIYCASAAGWYVEPGELPRFDELPTRGS